VVANSLSFFAFLAPSRFKESRFYLCVLRSGTCCSNDYFLFTSSSWCTPPAFPSDRTAFRTPGNGATGRRRTRHARARDGPRTMAPWLPTTMDASAVGATRSRLPVAWLGSKITGRWVIFLTSGMMARSAVFRVAVSKVRIPRSHRTTSGLPFTRIYSAEPSHSSTVAERPRFRMTGLFIFRPRSADRSSACFARRSAGCPPCRPRSPTCSGLTISVTTRMPVSLRTRRAGPGRLPAAPGSCAGSSGACTHRREAPGPPAFSGNAPSS